MASRREHHTYANGAVEAGWMRDGWLAEHNRSLTRVISTVWPIFIVHLLIVLTAVALWQHYFGTLSHHILPQQMGAFIAGLSHWDATWFLQIAKRGYVPGAPDDAAFFPLYPATMGVLGRVLSLLMHGHWGGAVADRTYFLSGILISNAAFFVSLVLLYYLGRRFLSTRQVIRGLWLFALFPSSFYFSAAYSESMFVMLVATAFLFAYRNRMAASGLAMGLAALCWDLGIFGTIALAWLVWKSYRNNRRVLVALRNVAAVTLIPVACLFVYFAWLDKVYGNPLMFLWAEKHHWNRHFAFIWTSLRLDYQYDPIGFLASVLFLALLLLSIRALPLEMWIYSALVLLVPLFSVAGVYPLSMVRFVLMPFPLFLFFGARLKRFETYFAVLAAFAIVLMWLTGLFASAHWVA